MKRKTTCRVQFEDRQGHLRTVKVRVPHKVPLTHGRIVTLASYKSGKFVSSVFGVTCADASGRYKTFLPHKRRRK